jgi:sigma-B regulation protein RsbU (phosphoserine phosphatase)
MKVLIADDDRLSAAMLQRRLEGWGLQVVVVPDGAQAWEAIQQDPAISLAIVDWMMPAIEGPELCRRIRLDEAHAHIYLLLVTSRDSRADIVSGMDAGADDYLTKPIDPEEFRVRLNAGLRVVTLQQRLAQRVRQLEEAASNIVQLHGLLPICSYCKNVRTDENYWLQVEDYVAERSALQFSHGICPKCYETEVERT